MRVETNHALIIYGVGYVSTVTLLTPFFYKYSSSGFIKAINNHMNLYYDRCFYHVPVFNCVYYNRSLR